MAVDPELLELFASGSVTLYPPATLDGFGRTASEADPVVVERTHIEYEEHYAKGDPGQTRMAVGKAYLDDVYPATDSWRVELPAGNPVSVAAVKIEWVEQYDDENGAYSTVLHFGSR